MRPFDEHIADLNHATSQRRQGISPALRIAEDAIASDRLRTTLSHLISNEEQPLERDILAATAVIIESLNRERALAGLPPVDVPVTDCDWSPWVSRSLVWKVVYDTSRDAGETIRHASNATRFFANHVPDEWVLRDPESPRDGKIRVNIMRLRERFPIIGPEEIDILRLRRTERF